jgi:Flp pilus assembly protein TadB
VNGPTKDDSGDDAERTVEALSKELALKLRSMEKREELTEYAVSLLRESNEDAGQEERAQESRAEAAKSGPFNPIAFGIPLLVIGVVLCGTGILIGPGLAVIAIAVLMVLYGMVALLVGGRRSRKSGPGEGGDRE